MSSKQRWVKLRQAGLMKNLQKYGAVDPDAKYGTLIDQEIHPVFQYANWRDTPLQTWRDFDLALKLASKLITEDATLDWWIALVTGEPTPVDPKNEEDRRYLKIPPGQTRAEGLEQVKAAINGMVPYLQFGIKAADPEWRAYGVNFLDTIRLVERDEHSTTFRNRGNNFGINTLLNVVYSKVPKAPEDKVLRFHFMLASTLVHELTHSMFRLRFGENYQIVDERTQRGKRTVRVDKDDFHPEEGYSWEQATFDCIPLSVALDKVDPWKYGLFAVSSVAHITAGRMSDDYQPAWIRMEWIAAWFTQSFWDRLAQTGLDRTEDCRSLFHIMPGKVSAVGERPKKGKRPFKVTKPRQNESGSGKSRLTPGKN